MCVLLLPTASTSDLGGSIDLQLLVPTWLIGIESLDPGKAHAAGEVFNQ